MVDPKPNAAELMAEIEKLLKASPDEQEAAYAEFANEHGAEVAAKVRELLWPKPELSKPDPVPKPEPVKGWRRDFKATVAVPKPAPIPGPPKPAPREEAGTKKAAVKRKYGWAEVVMPKVVSEIEALTYVPGLVGQIVDWIVAGARRPNRVMALGVALGVVGTLIGRRVEGPTGNATHLYIFILAPTGWGKDYPLWCGNKLMIAVGATSLLGPSEFVSGRGIIKYLKRNPLTLCIVDELGDVFQLINGQHDNPWVTDLIGHFKKLYNSWEIIITAETMRDESTTINHPAVTIVGACTPQALFEALKPGDVESGFANRPMLLPFEGFKRPPERDVPEGAEEPPTTLVAELRQLRQLRSVADILNTPVSEIDDGSPPVLRKDREKWPAPGSEDTELGVLMELEVGHGETEVHAGVQA